uniref:Prenylcysteine lyase domain-containing protein n=1 Tax=Kalanchoe fedtschenkoi TaxID=63787 RepID=A0A7N0TW26_KALFE
MKKSPAARCIFLLLILQPLLLVSVQSLDVCIIGSGIGGASVAHFLRHYSTIPLSIKLFERNAVVGGRMATVTIAGDTFEAGASILHPKNYYALNFTNSLQLSINQPSSSQDDDLASSFGIWDGHKFLFKTIKSGSKSWIMQRIIAYANTAIVFFRYGFSLLRMDAFVESTVNKFLKYYESLESRPVFSTVEEMLQWSGLYNLTARSLEDELTDAGLSSLLIRELVTVITRINYGQSVKMSGLAGAVSLAGSGGGLWSVAGGNKQMAAGLINRSDVDLHLLENIKSISNLGNYYELNSTGGNSYACDVTVVATPLDEVAIEFSPPVVVAERKLQHTYTTFVRGILNPAFFGLSSASDIPDLVGTVEDPNIPFSSISVLKEYDDRDKTFKIFSRAPMQDALLDDLFSERTDTIHIDWAAYPQYHPPEKFSKFVLDDKHLYYANAFESGASTMETSAVSGENIARLILSRLSGETMDRESILKNSIYDGKVQGSKHSDL